MKIDFIHDVVNDLGEIEIKVHNDDHKHLKNFVERREGQALNLSIEMRKDGPVYCVIICDESSRDFVTLPVVGAENIAALEIFHTKCGGILYEVRARVDVWNSVSIIKMALVPRAAAEVN